ncbi:MAG TPA: polysaccharide biosynthesis tyrosine autokinase [Candidatus Binatia bacterium]|jgi:capsular exopolysaccharide synthesis family protein|nr:polysaccharide biosynthesis tyrosine autokinase [Candidatus Binatia bacterium]
MRTPTTLAAAPPASLAPDVLEAEFSEAPQRHLRDHLRVLYKYRWLASTCFALTVGAAILLTLMTPRQFTASTRLQVARESNIQLRLAENVLRPDEPDRVVNGGSSFLATQVAILQSRDLAERVIRGQHLAQNEAFLHPTAERAGLFALGERVMGAVRPRGWNAAAPVTADAGGSGEAPDVELLDRYMRWLSVRDVRGTDLVEIRFTTPNAALSALLAAAHAQAYLEANEEVRLEANVTAKDFLGKQMHESRSRVEQAEDALGRFASAHPNIAINEEHKLVPQRLQELQTLLTKAESGRQSLETKLDFLGGADGERLAYFLDRPGVQKLRLSEVEIGAQMAALSARLGPNHPQIIELGTQLGAVRKQITTEVTQEMASLKARFAAAALREGGLRQTIAVQEASAIAARDLGSRWELLRRDADTAHALHQSLLTQQLQTAVTSELAASNVRVVERSELPAGPSSPNVPLNLVLGVLGGLGLAVGAAFACEYFDSSLKSGEEVEDLLQLAPLATIPNFAMARRSAAKLGLGARAGGAAPQIGEGPGPELVVLHEPWSVVSEAFRGLRTAVLFSAANAPPRVILVTSAGAGEGKTVSSLNLATTLADAGSRVLLVDVDLRRPSCHRVLRIENERGLSSVLAGQVTFADACRHLEAPRLDFVPAGPTPPNPAELVGSQRMRDLLAELRGQYDYVILDSPPTLPVTDSVVLAREVDGVVLVVKGHDTPRELVRRARDRLVGAGAPMLGAVINNVDLGWGDLYFYNRYYNYHYVQGPQALEARS